MNLEYAKKRLAEINSKSDPLLNSFYGGRVGFRKYSKRDNQKFDRELKEAAESVRLRDFIDNEERKKLIKDNPAPSPYYSNVNEFEPGKKYRDFCYGLVEVIKINKNTVTIKTVSGYTEPRKPTYFFK